MIGQRRDIQLRPYQQEAVDAIARSHRENQSCLMVMATGLGKTVVAAEYIRRMNNGRTMFTAHREELIRQAEGTVGRVTGIMPQIEMADLKADSLGFSTGADCIIASVQTLNAKMSDRYRMMRFDPKQFALLVSDEAHHGVAKSWLRIADHFCSNPTLRHLGMTATPDRADEEALGQVYEDVAYQYEILDAIHDGWLVPIMMDTLEVDAIDLRNVGEVAGDLNQGELAEVMEFEGVLHGVAAPILDIASSLKTLVFTTSVKHAARLSEILNRKKPGSSAMVCGKTPKDERRSIMEQYRAGRIQYLCNVGVATEGFDVPDIECVAIARPTTSRALFAQMVGRGTRALAGVVDGLERGGERVNAISESGKPHLLVLDFVGNSGSHKLASCADILGGQYTARVRETAGRIARNEGPVDTIELLKRAKAQVKGEIEKEAAARRRAGIHAKVKYRRGRVDPFDLLDISPRRTNYEWKMKPLTAQQQAWLERNGCDVEMLTVEQQRQVLGQLINRKKRGLCTLKQANILKRYGYPASVTFDEASSIIDRIANNGWKA